MDAPVARRRSGGGGKIRGGSTQQSIASIDRREASPGSSSWIPPLPLPLPLPQQVACPWPGGGANSGSDFIPHQGYSPQNPWGYPQGGFVNFLQQPYCPPPAQGENFHFTGLINQNLDGTSPEPSSKGTPTPEQPSSKQTRSRKEKISINIDDDDSEEASRTKKRWSHDEEVVLANAWLNTSNDPIHGHDKKGETFWMQVTEEYNRQVPVNRKRVSNQLQIHWSHLKTSINDFNGFWSTVSKLHTSGYSDDQLMAEAQKLYKNKYGKPFALVHWWTTLKNEPKWCAYVERLEKKEKENVTNDVANDRDKPRPMGREAAKAHCMEGSTLGVIKRAQP